MALRSKKNGVLGQVCKQGMSISVLPEFRLEKLGSQAVKNGYQ
jgi:hypothetical protein